MCAIAGIISHKINSDYQTVLQSILALQTPRGPDVCQMAKVCSQPVNVVLAHNRLKIIDLSDDANQPLWNATKRYCITYNGEIYNYLELRKELIDQGFHFNTHSDTEVILNAFAAWGIEALQRFNGAFAFALWDKNTHALWLCRDRFGKKPLYYYESVDAFYFASLPQALAKPLDLAPNLAYAARGLKYWVYEDDSDIAPYVGVRQVPAGCYLKLMLTPRDKKQTLQRYYDLAAAVQIQQARMAGYTREQLLENAHALLENALEIRLRADVPLGISLSGGLDSASVAAMVADKATKRHESVNAFSYADPHNPQTEGPLVQTLSQQLGIKTHYIQPDANAFRQALWDTLDAQGAPFGHASVIAQYLVYQHASQAGVKVLLGGQGGDEGFMGYRKFQLFWLRQLVWQRNYGNALCFLWHFQTMLWAEMGRLRHFWRQRYRYQARSQFNTRLNLVEVQNLALGQERSDTHLQARQIADITRFSLPSLLRYEDRNSLGNSVESRLPLMDHRLLELAIALPVHLKLHKGYGKWVLRELMYAKIPDSIRLAKYKRGFDVEMRKLMCQGVGASIREQLSHRQDKFGPYVAAGLAKGIDIQDDFSDRALLQRPHAFAEAMTLLWLGS